MTTKNIFGKILEMIGVDVAMHPITTGFWKIIEKALGLATSEQVQKQIQEKFGPADRNWLWGFIESALYREDAAATRGFQRHQERIKRTKPPGHENRMNRLLADLLKNCMERFDENTTLQIFKKIGHMTAKEFDNLLEALDNDGFVQFAKLVAYGTKKGLVQLDRTGAKQLNRISKDLEKNFGLSQPRRRPARRTIQANTLSYVIATLLLAGLITMTWILGNHIVFTR